MRIRLQNPDEMEAPCKCNCGAWFELSEGYGDGSGTVVCDSCHERNQKVSDLEEEIRDLENAIQDAEITIRDSRPRLKELIKQLQEL